MECTDIYCKVEARKRMGSSNLSPSEIENVAEEVFKRVKKMVDNGKSQH